MRPSGSARTATCSTWSRASRAPVRRRRWRRKRSACSAAATRWATPPRPASSSSREAIAGHHRERYGLEVGADDVIVTTGSSGGFLLAFLAAFDAGARVAIARPGYPCYRNVLAALGCTVVEVATGPETRFQPTVEQTRRGARAAAPRRARRRQPGQPDRHHAAARGGSPRSRAGARRTGCSLVSDEIYHGIQYAGARAASAWETSREAIVFGSFSKYFSMTGWRLGWMLAPERLRRPVDVLTGNFSICPPVLSQRAALAAFTPASYAEPGRARAALRPQPGPAAGGPAPAGHHRAGAGRRRLLRLRRRGPPDA
ncbi:aminotransferase class I/II-fold pyridoxal phosphate-dependent enzyme [Nocardioides convexus]|uniref:aminotransferase class I/II-fold pyridoxal phosphate-dependent enzyme n=1 Tax=Nocardioides convexus TaxID=2712224 RepID=UPI002418529B|nr:aminotransferase class I/II-fold pyridoxal phosphate-dependent enzyme [Nocardioides convexus]